MITDTALAFATEKHKGQNRTITKKPYITHPINVAKILKQNKKCDNIEELMAAALLHDTLEETNTTRKELKSIFGELITSLVIELTTDKKEAEKLGKTKYLAQKMSNESKMSSWALAIKLSDRLDNVSDLKNGTKEFRDKYTKQTNYIIDYVEKNRNLSSTHKKLIKKIRRKLNG